MAGLDSFLPGGAGRDAAELLQGAVRNRRRRTAYDDVLWGTARTYFLCVLLFLAVLWGIACAASAVFAFAGGSTETEEDGWLGLSLLVAALAPVAGTVVLLRRRPHQWWWALAAALSTVGGVLVADLLQR